MAEEEKKKVKTPTAKKRDLQKDKKTLKNKIFKSKVKTAIRSFEKSDKESTEKGLNLIYSLLDKGVKRGLFKKNKANRVKAKYAAQQNNR